MIPSRAYLKALKHFVVVQVGAGLGTVAGAVGGVAAAGGASTLATCPALAITTLAGSSIVSLVDVMRLN